MPSPKVRNAETLTLEALAAYNFLISRFPG
jgi:hypothetical protein